jgi:hypothetical protein
MIRIWFKGGKGGKAEGRKGRRAKRLLIAVRDFADDK